MEKVLRSLIHEMFPLDLRVKIALLSKRRDLINAEKQEELFKLLREYNVDATPLGPGTNRYAFKCNGFVVKLATDRDGIIDNYKEFKMVSRLPLKNFMKVYEISDNGTLLVCEYIQVFYSYGEFYQYADRIREVLKELSAVYLIGDVGVTAKNYSNWGLRVGSDEPVCLDYAYVYDVSSELLLCTKCRNQSMLVPDKDFVHLLCPACGATYEFSDIRRRIGNDLHRHEIGDLSEEAYLMTDSNILTQLDIKRSPYLKPEVVRTPIVKKEEEEPEPIGPLTQINIANQFKEDENMITQDVSFRKPITIKATAAIAEPEQQDEIAFTSPIATCEVVGIKEWPFDEPPHDDATTIVSDMAYFNKHEEPKEEPKPEPVIEEVAIATPLEHVFSEDFLKNVHYAANHLANSIIKTIDGSNLFDTCKNDIGQKNIFAGDFSRGVAGALYKAIVGFCNFTQIQIPNREGEGTHRGYAAPENINGEVYMPTMRLLETTYIDDELKEIDEAQKLMDAYHAKYDDEPSLQREIIPIFRNELAKRMKIREGGITKILNFVDHIMFETVESADVRIFANAFAEAAAEPEDTTLKDKLDAAIAESSSTEVSEDDINKILSDAAESVFMAEEPAKEDVAFTASVDDDTDEASDDEESGSGEGTVTIYLMHEEDTDIIKMETEDSFGKVNIPCYIKMSEVDTSKTMPSMIDDRNTYWDFLAHLVPSIMFKTDDPEKYLSANDDDIAENQIHPVILDENETNEYVMGIYLVSGIYDVDDDGNCTQITDIDTIKKINKVLLDVIATGSMSHLHRTIIRKDLIHDESVLDGIVDYVEVDYTTEEESVEDAAISAVLGNEEPVEQEESLLFDPILPKR